MLLDKKRLQRLTRKIFAAVQGVTKPAKFHHFSGAAYVASSGGFSAGSYETFDVRVIVNEFRTKEVDNIQVMAQDLQVILPADQTGNRKPTTADKIQIDDKLWAIVGIKMDASLTTYILQVR